MIEERAIGSVTHGGGFLARRSPPGPGTSPTDSQGPGAVTRFVPSRYANTPRR
jgi:hypothetical protein